MGQMVGAFNTLSSRNKNSNDTTSNSRSTKKKPKKRKEKNAHLPTTKDSNGMPLIRSDSRSSSSSSSSSSNSSGGGGGDGGGGSSCSHSSLNDDSADSAASSVCEFDDRHEEDANGNPGTATASVRDPILSSTILSSLLVNSLRTDTGKNSKFGEVSIRNRNGKIVLANGEEKIDVTQTVLHPATASNSRTNNLMNSAFATAPSPLSPPPPFLSNKFSSFMTRQRTAKKNVPSPSKNYESSMSSSSIIQPSTSNQQNSNIQSNYTDYSAKILPPSFPFFNTVNDNTTLNNTNSCATRAVQPKEVAAKDTRNVSTKPSVTMATEPPTSNLAAAVTFEEDEEDEEDEEPVEMEQLIAMMRNHKVSDETASFNFNFGTAGQPKNLAAAAAAVAAAAVNAPSSSIPNSTPEFNFSFAANSNIPMKPIATTASQTDAIDNTTTSSSTTITTTTITTTSAAAAAAAATTATMTNDHDIPSLNSDIAAASTSSSSHPFKALEEEGKTVELTPEEQNYYRFVYEHQSAYVDVHQELDVDKYEDEYTSGPTETDAKLSLERQQQIHQEIVARRKILPLPKLRRKKKAVLDHYSYNDNFTPKVASASSSKHFAEGATPTMPILKFSTPTTATSSTAVESNSTSSNNSTQGFCFPSTSLISKNMFNFYPTTTPTTANTSGSPTSTLSFNDLAKKLSNENQQHRIASFDGSFNSDTDNSSSHSSSNAKKMKWSGTSWSGTSSSASRVASSEAMIAAADAYKRKQRNWIESFSGDLSDLQKEIDLRKQQQQQQQQQQTSSDSSEVLLTKDTLTLPKAAQTASPVNTNTIHVNTTDTSHSTTTTTTTTAAAAVEQPGVCASAEIDRMLHDFKVLSQSPAFKLATTPSSAPVDITDRLIATMHPSRIRHSAKGKARRSTPFTTPPAISAPVMTAAPSSAIAAVTQAKQLEQQQKNKPPTSSTFAVPNVVTKKFLAPSVQQLQQEEQQQQQQQSLKKKGSIFDTGTSNSAKKGAFATKTMGMALTTEGGKKRIAASKKASLNKPSMTVTALTTSATTATAAITTSAKKNKKNKNKNNKEQQDDFMAPGGFLSSDISLFDNPIPDEWVCLFCQYDILMYGYEQAKKKNGFYKRKRQREKKLKEAELRKNNKEKEIVACENEHNHHHHHNGTGSGTQDLTNDTTLQQPAGDVDHLQQQQVTVSQFASAK